MNSLLIISHLRLTEKLLLEIIRIKSTAWSYPYHEQLQWLNQNIKSDDKHVLLKQNTSYVAYLNLINVELIINGKSYKGLGVGNVCASEKGRGYGRTLIQLTNQHIISENDTGLLFCKQNLIKFYQENGWVVMDKNSLDINFKSHDIEIMIFNYNQPIIQLIYKDRLF